MINITSNSPNYFYNSRTKLGKKNVYVYALDDDLPPNDDAQ